MCCVLRPDDFEMAGSDYHQTYFLTIPIKSSNEQKKNILKANYSTLGQADVSNLQGLIKPSFERNAILLMIFGITTVFAKRGTFSKDFLPSLYPLILRRMAS